MPAREFETLVDLLEVRAAENPDHEALFVEGRWWSFRELWWESQRFAGYLAERGNEPGARLIVAIPNRVEFFVAFYGCQLAGLIPVPVCPDYSIRRIRSLALLCRAPAIVCSEEKHLTEGQETSPEDDIELLTVGKGGARSSRRRFPRVEASDVALILMTSGSTGDSKAVQLTHSNILANLRSMIPRMKITSRDVFVSWLPTFHDMGLILMTLAPFHQGARLVLLPARSHPNLWLRSIEEYGGSVIASPDFGYRYCLYAVRKASGYQCGSLRLALNAAEPVRARTIADFETRFGLDHVFVPAYGLAESTAGVSCCEPGCPIRIDDEGRVSVGQPFPGVQVRIEEEAGAGSERREGEILVKSPSNTVGYLDGSGRTTGLTDPDGYLRTGDLGYLDPQGQLFITGRMKDMIIQAGRNLAPGEVEEVIDELDVIRYSAAVGIERYRRPGEQVVVFAEVRRPDAGDRFYASLTREIVNELHRQLGFRPGEVYLVRPQTISRTPNGKLRRSYLKEQFLAGELHRSHSILFPQQ
jgi:acyl-CoA synthetase (AMP-forming)/AMP-acid ligase II